MDDNDKLNVLSYILRRYCDEQIVKKIDGDYERLTGEGIPM